MSLKSCEKAETNVYALEISLEGEEFKKAVSNAYNKNKGRYNVPGFRKGKAPKHIIETYYGKEVFWYDAIDAEYPALFDSAAKEAGIVPVAAPFDIRYQSWLLYHPMHQSFPRLYQSRQKDRPSSRILFQLVYSLFQIALKKCHYIIGFIFGCLLFIFCIVLNTNISRGIGKHHYKGLIIDLI